MQRSRPGLALLAAALLGAAAAGCTPKIGSKCTLSTDCSVTGDRVCDTSQPNGYCTVLNCSNNSCPDHAVCVLFQANVPGCAYDDYQSPSRTGRSFCMEHCNENSDCRQSEGYTCTDPAGSPWHGYILDNNQNQKVCIIPASLLSEDQANFGAPVCAPAVPPDASVDASSEADAGEGSEAGEAGEGSDAANEAGAPDATEEDAGAPDATLDAPVDAGDAGGDG